MLGIILVTNDIDGKAMPPGSRKHVNATALQRGTCQLRLAATFLECAFLAEVAWTCSHTERFVESLQKEPVFKGQGNLFGLAAAGLEQNSTLVLIQHLARLSREQRVGRTHQVGPVAAAPEAALPAYPVGCYNPFGRHNLRFFGSKLDRLLHDFTFRQIEQYVFAIFFHGGYIWKKFAHIFQK